MSKAESSAWAPSKSLMNMNYYCFNNPIVNPNVLQMVTAGTPLYLSKSHKKPSPTTQHIMALVCVTSACLPLVKTSHLANLTTDGQATKSYGRRRSEGL